MIDVCHIAIVHGFDLISAQQDC
uniref:Uncharacterized protein n=1 Tax=Arundo donax TaxID=35708 RepID=A0A0A8Z9E8_ARUDO